MGIINSLDEFKNELKLIHDKKNSVKEFQDIFNPMAKFALTNLAIKVGNIKYYLLEIEFYYCNKRLEEEETFKRTYRRECKAEEFFLHYSGLDICFATSEDKDSYGGILIRSVLKHEDDNKEDVIISGPLKCANEIINQCFKSKKKAYPEIVYDQSRIKGDIWATIRQGIETSAKFETLRDNYNKHIISDDLFPRFAYYIEGVKWENNYSANPSVNYKKDNTEPRGKYSKPI